MVVHNAKYEMKILARYGIERDWWQYYDTMVPIHVENSNNRKGLKKAVKKLFGVLMTEYEDVVGSGKKKITFDQVPIEEAAKYCGADCYYTLKIYSYYKNMFDARQRAVLDLDREAQHVSMVMELNGIGLDVEHFKTTLANITDYLGPVKARLFEIVGGEFNLNSTKQLLEVIYGHLGMECPEIKETTKEKTLTKMIRRTDEPLHKEFLEKLLEYRSLSKIKTTYLTLPEKIEPVTGRVHGSFNPFGTKTGRFSSSGPNLQNLPASGLGKEVRRGIIAAPGNVLIAADYSQIELRVFAQLGQDELMLKAFKNGEDIHKKVAATILHKPIEEVTPAERHTCKTYNLAIMYMRGVRSIAEDLDISVEAAKEFRDDYFVKVPSLQPLMDEIFNFCRKHGYVETLLGRRRYFPNINSKNWKLKGPAERGAFNAVIQGTAADIMKQALYDLHVYFKDTPAKLIMTVHDEAVIECPEDIAAEVELQMKTIMEGAVRLKDVSLDVEVKRAYNYADTK
jgi:DNA polymerase-1